jgi:hypothetical protein
MGLKRLAVSAALGVAAFAFAAPSQATVLVANTGWQYDQVDHTNAESQSSPITFTVKSGTEGLFSLSDGFKAGDVYKVIIDGVITATSTFTVYSTPFDNSLGDSADFAADWLNASFSHLQLNFDPGTYTLTVFGNGAGGLPAGVGERLDVLAIPEPATWLTMLIGFGGLGLSMRNSRRKQALAA